MRPSSSPFVSPAMVGNRPSSSAPLAPSSSTTAGAVGGACSSTSSQSSSKFFRFLQRLFLTNRYLKRLPLQGRAYDLMGAIILIFTVLVILPAISAVEEEDDSHCFYSRASTKTSLELIRSYQASLTATAGASGEAEGVGEKKRAVVAAAAGGHTATQHDDDAFIAAVPPSHRPAVILAKLAAVSERVKATRATLSQLEAALVETRNALADLEKSHKEEREHDRSADAAADNADADGVGSGGGGGEKEAANGENAEVGRGATGKRRGGGGNAYVQLDPATEALIDAAAASADGITADLAKTVKDATMAMDTLKHQRDGKYIVKWFKGDANDLTIEERKLLVDAAAANTDGDGESSSFMSSSSTAEFDLNTFNIEYFQRHQNVGGGFTISSPRLHDELSALRFYRGKIKEVESGGGGSGGGNDPNNNPNPNYHRQHQQQQLPIKLLMFDGFRWIPVKEQGGERWLARMKNDGGGEGGK